MILLLFTALTVSSCSTFASSKKGFEIMDKAYKFDDGFIGELSEIKMTLINAQQESIERKFKLKIHEVKNEGDKSVFTFIWPPDVRNTKLLTWTKKSEDDQQWIYLPALKRVKRISSVNKTGSFMGSEFSYEDLISQEVEKFTYKYLKDVKPNNRPTWKIHGTPNYENSGYSKQHIYMDKEYLAITKIKYFDRKGKLLKIAKFSNWKKYGKYWKANKIIIKNLQTKKASIFEWASRKIGIKFSETDFSQNRLKL